MRTTDHDPTALDDTLADIARDAPPDEQPALAATAAAVRAAADVRDALGQLHATEDEAWARYSQTVREAMAEAEAELIVAVAQLRAERATSHEELGAALDQVAESVRGRIEEMRVRAHLGRMDLADRADEAIDELDRTGAALRDASRRLAHDATHDLDALRRDTLAGLAAAVGALRRLALGRDGGQGGEP